ncbi:MAG: cytochrome c peroxidase [Spirosomataceae bacterium]
MKYTFTLLASAAFLSTLFWSCGSNKEAVETSGDQQLRQALSTASAGKGLPYYLLPESTDFQNIPQDPRNPLTADKVALGKLLFHETGLSMNPNKSAGYQTYSCASCHHAKAGFQACVPQGIAEGGSGFGKSGESRTIGSGYTAKEVDVQAIRSPSAMNVAFQKNILWNGQFGATHLNLGTEAAWSVGTPKEKNKLGFEGLETQAIAGQGVHHLGFNPNFIINKTEYRELYDKVFGLKTINNPEQSVINVGLAIAAYERTLFSNQAPFQRWLKGEYSAMTDDQKSGAVLFFGKARCYTCHNGPALANMEFHSLGFRDLTNGQYGNNIVVNAGSEKVEHKGRGGFTGRAADMYKFKVPQLYNLKDSPFYGHGASFTKIEDVIAYKNAAVSQNANVPRAQLASEFVPLQLTPLEVKQLTEFIKEGLYDPKLSRYVPQSLPSGLAFPNNDAVSRKDLGF